jgi:dihydroflavonol-4-reductase
MILVTGATGFLGSVLTRQLVKQGRQVRALKREHSVIPAFLQNQPNLEWVNGDMLDLFALEDALEGVSQVYHTAAVVSFDPRDKNRLLKDNVEGTANLVNLCLELGGIRLLHVSSVAALGKAKEDNPITEENYFEAEKASSYALSKHLSEIEVWRGIAEGLDAVIVNPSIIIGKESGTKGSGALFITVKRGLNSYPGGSCGLVGVEDVAAAMIQLMDSGISGERFILNAENWTYRDLFAEIAKQFGIKGPRKPVANWQLLWVAHILSIVGKLRGKSFSLSLETARSAGKKSSFSHEKISKSIGIRFTPIRHIIAETCDSLK